MPSFPRSLHLLHGTRVLQVSRQELSRRHDRRFVVVSTTILESTITCGADRVRQLLFEAHRRFVTRMLDIAVDFCGSLSSMAKKTRVALVPVEHIARAILVLRGQKVLLD